MINEANFINRRIWKINIMHKHTVWSDKLYNSTHNFRLVLTTIRNNSDISWWYRFPFGNPQKKKKTIKTQNWLSTAKWNYYSSTTVVWLATVIQVHQHLDIISHIHAMLYPQLSSHDYCESNCIILQSLVTLFRMGKLIWYIKTLDISRNSEYGYAPYPSFHFEYYRYHTP